MRKRVEIEDNLHITKRELKKEREILLEKLSNIEKSIKEKDSTIQKFQELVAAYKVKVQDYE